MMLESFTCFSQFSFADGEPTLALLAQSQGQLLRAGTLHFWSNVEENMLHLPSEL